MELAHHGYTLSGPHDYLKGMMRDPLFPSVTLSRDKDPKEELSVRTFSLTRAVAGLPSRQIILLTPLAGKGDWIP